MDNGRHQCYLKGLRNLGADGNPIMPPFGSAIWPLYKSDES